MDQLTASLNFDQKVILLINHMQANGFVVQRMRVGDDKMQVVVGEITQQNQAWYYVESGTPWNPKKMGEHHFLISGPFTACSEDYVVLNNLHSNEAMKAVYLKNFVKLQDVLAEVFREIGAQWYSFYTGYTGGAVIPLSQSQFDAAPAPAPTLKVVDGETIDDTPRVTEKAAKDSATLKRKEFILLFQEIVTTLMKKLPLREAEWVTAPLLSFTKGTEFFSAVDDLINSGSLRQRFSRIYFQEVFAAVHAHSELKLSENATLRAIVKAYQNDQKRNKVTENQLIDLDIIPSDDPPVLSEADLVMAEENFKTLCDDLIVSLSARLQPAVKAEVTVPWERFMDTPEFLDHARKYVRFGITGTFTDTCFKDVFLAIAHHAVKHTGKDVVMKEMLRAYRDKQMRDGIPMDRLLDPDIYFPHVRLAPRQ